MDFSKGLERYRFSKFGVRFLRNEAGRVWKRFFHETDLRISVLNVVSESLL
jgi:hypothetical protein